MPRKILTWTNGVCLICIVLLVLFCFSACLPSASSAVTEEIMNKYLRYADEIQEYDESMEVYPSNYTCEDGCYYQLIGVEMGGTYYNISFCCTFSGKETLEFSVSKAEDQPISVNDLEFMAFLIEKYSLKQFETAVVLQKCREAVENYNDTTRMAKDYYFTNIAGEEIFFVGLLK